MFESLSSFDTRGHPLLFLAPPGRGSFAGDLLAPLFR
jgi:hypothetical protein